MAIDQLYSVEATMNALGYDYMGNNNSLIAQVDLDYINIHGIKRSSGEVICTKCNSPYWMHPKVQGMLYMTRTCDAGLVHL